MGRLSLQTGKRSSFEREKFHPVADADDWGHSYQHGPEWWWPSQPTGTFTFPSVNGQPNRSNSFRLDGVINDASFTSTYAVQPDVDDIQEFKVQAHNDEAQFGQVLGGIINVVTKSGTNTFHGDVWEFFRNDALDARNFFVQDKTPLRQNQFGGAVGGPVSCPDTTAETRLSSTLVTKPSLTTPPTAVVYCSNSG